MSKEDFSKSKKQVKLLIAVVALASIGILTGVFWPEEKQEHPMPPGFSEEAFPYQNPKFSAEKARLSRLEVLTEKFEGEFQKLEAELQKSKEVNQVLEQKNQELQRKQSLHDIHLKALHEKTAKQAEFNSNRNFANTKTEKAVEVGIFSKPTLSTKKNVLTEIPAGTVVKCLLVTSADCSVGISSSSDPKPVLLQPIANGKLPKKVQVALKGSRILGTAVGDIASERVSIRAERLTLMQGSNGDYVETSMAGFVSGEDGKEGLRGLVCDRSGAIISRAAFASFLQGVGSSVQATLNNQTIEKVSKVGGTQSILDVDTFRNAGVGGANTALNKLAEYYIKRAEQLQPVIQVKAGRVVDVIFLKSVKLGEKDIQKSIQQERNEREWS
jgi:conjugal transfer pilus assembly protein TraB